MIPKDTVEVESHGNTYWISWFSLSEDELLYLKPNFLEKHTSRSIIEDKTCNKLIIGGFNTKNLA